jgi:hypothetical protein
MPSLTVLSRILSNAAYWFARAGEHPIFRSLREESSTLLGSTKVNWRLNKNWDTKLFADWCDEARRLPGSEKNRLAREIQRAECSRLFIWCALRTKDF